jgi:hypothetical protein
MTISPRLSDRSSTRSSRLTYFLPTGKVAIFGGYEPALNVKFPRLNFSSLSDRQQRIGIERFFGGTNALDNTCRIGRRLSLRFLSRGGSLLDNGITLDFS